MLSLDSPLSDEELDITSCFVVLELNSWSCSEAVLVEKGVNRSFVKLENCCNSSSSLNKSLFIEKIESSKSSVPEFQSFG